MVGFDKTYSSEIYFSADKTLVIDDIILLNETSFQSVN